MSGFTIYRRDGSVLFRSATATTTAQAVNELVAEARLNLSNADLRYANLSNADLRYADLSNADLSNADLSNADLSNADLRFANLSNADLSNADLRYADLRYADLRYADLRYARNVPYVLTIGPVDTWFVCLTNTTDGWRFSAGCRDFTIEEAREHWSKPSAWSEGAAPEHGARMLAAVDALIATATALGWPEKLVVEPEPAVAS